MGNGWNTTGKYGLCETRFAHSCSELVNSAARKKESAVSDVHDMRTTFLFEMVPGLQRKMS